MTTYHVSYEGAYSIAASASGKYVVRHMGIQFGTHFEEKHAKDAVVRDATRRIRARIARTRKELSSMEKDLQKLAPKTLHVLDQFEAK